MRLKAIAAALAALLGVGPLYTCARAANHGFPVDWDRSHAGAPLDLRGYRQAWGDEFDALRVSREGGPGPWYAPIHSNLGMGDLAVPPDPAIAVRGGQLVLTTRRAGGRWIEANVQSQDKAGHGFPALQDGYFEVRAELPRAGGTHTGLWLLSQQDPARGHCEIDIVESYGARDGVGHHASSHVWPAGGPHAFTSLITPTPGLLDGFHLFGALATPTQFIVYLDRREVGRIPRLPLQQAPLYLLLSEFETSTDPPQTPGTLKVDWVHAYAPAG